MSAAPSLYGSVRKSEDREAADFFVAIEADDMTWQRYARYAEGWAAVQRFADEVVSDAKANSRW